MAAGRDGDGRCRVVSTTSAKKRPCMAPAHVAREFDERSSEVLTREKWEDSHVG